MVVIRQLPFSKRVSLKKRVRMRKTPQYPSSKLFARVFEEMLASPHAYRTLKTSGISMMLRKSCVPRRKQSESTMLDFDIIQIKVPLSCRRMGIASSAIQNMFRAASLHNRGVFLECVITEEGCKLAQSLVRKKLFRVCPFDDCSFLSE